MRDDPRSFIPTECSICHRMVIGLLTTIVDGERICDVCRDEATKCQYHFVNCRICGRRLLSYNGGGICHACKQKEIEYQKGENHAKNSI